MSKPEQRRRGPVYWFTEEFKLFYKGDPPFARRMILFIISLLVATPLLAIFGVWWIGGPVFSAGTLRSLPGKTQEEARQILGEPSEIGDSGEWHYIHPRNPGWVTIHFHEDGRVSGVNDEQAAPELFGSGSW